MLVAVEETNNEINFYKVNGKTFCIKKLIEMFKKANREIKQVFSYKSRNENDFIGAKLIYNIEKDG
jgi:DNA integrity scanning protein DisA with diadenylate cyclase activity